MTALGMLKGHSQLQIRKILQEKSSQLTLEQKHDIRVNILSSEIMRQTNSMSCQLSVRHFHIDYPFQDKNQAFFLGSCTLYHPWHISYIVQEIARTGSFVCPQCKTEVRQLSQIVPDAFVMSYFKMAQYYSGTHLLLNIKKVGQEEIIKTLRSALLDQLVTVLKQQSTVVEVKLWQLVKDDRLDHLDIQTVTTKMQTFRQEEVKQYQHKYLQSSLPILVNLICYSSQVRIRNPLIHRHCTPATHSNRLFLFSFEHIYHNLLISPEKIRCPFPNCPNYFDKNNFSKCGLVLPKLQKSMYEQKQQNMYGLYFAGVYCKNWHLGFSQEKYSNIDQKTFGEVQQRVQELLKTVTLLEGAKKVRKLHQKLTSRINKDSMIEPKDTQLPVLLGEATLCPVRCYKCPSLEAKDIFEVALELTTSQKIICPICKYQFKNKQFYDVFYLDIGLMKCIFVNGHSRQFLFDTLLQQYVAKNQQIDDLYIQKNKIRQVVKLSQMQPQNQKKKKVHIQPKFGSFTSLKLKYPNQFKNLVLKTNRSKNPPQPSVSFDDFQTNGNTLLFKYPVPTRQGGLSPEQFKTFLQQHNIGK